jgi:hypothetical protein
MPLIKLKQFLFGYIILVMTRCNLVDTKLKKMFVMVK